MGTSALFPSQASPDAAEPTESGWDAIIVGAGPAGLGCAAMMREAGLAPLVVEKRDAVAATWRGHYDCLHLHSERAFSSLPGLSMPESYLRFPSRQQVIDYLEAYAAKFDIHPRLGVEVRAIRRNGARWDVDCDGSTLSAPIVVVAVGWASFPFRPACPGLDEYLGTVLHSSEYRNPAPYTGKRVLVVGYGNSGGEIALDLVRANVDTTLSVRSPIQVMPRTILGISTTTFGVFQRKVPAGLADLLNVPLLILTTGRLEKIGLRRMSKGPRRLVKEDGRAPIVDIGTLKKIRDGAIKLRGGLARFTRDSVVFQNSSAEAFDAIIFATGFRTDLRQMLPDADGVLDANGYPRISGAPSGQPGLYFCGTTISPAGQFHAIGVEAKRIARLASESLGLRRSRRHQKPLVSAR
jgi:cation diffusion facilitator CzcD-associated flavoprotein CzcO